MKLGFLSLLVIPVVLSCGNTSSQLPGRTVEGNYVAQSKSEFSVADDTLSINAIAGQQSMYSIKRSVSYQRVTEKGTRPKESKQEFATAIWEPQSSQLKEQKHGRVYSLSADGSQLMIGTMIYTKILPGKG
ncbi:hypothetical protein [Flavisolibacter nicotianae]|uniref:hypothetical protein n=1 Tax=Flavisolibacter nicotianae TaxID=2364882 RepID=UPI000EAEA81C|nr:hypothetical protein [Flavisolibacter nicotianae]